LEGVQPGSALGRDDPGQDVAGACAGEPGGRRGDGGAPIRRGDDGVGPLEENHGARPGGRGAGLFDLAALCDSKQLPEFAGMRGQDRHVGQPLKPGEVEQDEGVGIKH
jgi:hypothetical protein